MEINFYHVASGNLVLSIVRLLEKIYLAQERCIFFSPLEERIRTVNKALWTFSTDAFIPHGDESLGFSEKQPIYFANRGENPNGAKIAMLVDTLCYKDYDNFEKIILIFEEKEQAENADALYSDLKNNQINVSYWKQSPRGWEKKI
ncbi:MAG: DNA polymerase III subunit chi [Holosporaceae bacterium]|jgi:DNA polymerase-3 subunit chi|nr:DNA polymerase III subunit chi [Holosporaceae bacterium]